MSLGFDVLLEALRGAGEGTRLRILALLAESELTVTDLTEIVRQSQPVVSRHMKVLVDAGMVTRFREGSWAFFRLSYTSPTGATIRQMLSQLDPTDPTISRDRSRLAAVRAARSAAAQDYFNSHAAEWDRLRQLHVADDRVEAAIKSTLGPDPIAVLLDVGTGTGRMLELLGNQVQRGMGVDLSREMLAIARPNLERAGLRHCTVQQGDLLDLPFAHDSFDVVVVHQVLHLLDDAQLAVSEAARVLKPGGRLLIVDFAPHTQESMRDEHAHRRLGFATASISRWLRAADLRVEAEHTIAPEADAVGRIAVSLWLGRDTRRPSLATEPASVVTTLRGPIS
jgi:ubiquinone/menaquinone biosynthesis C-methylase UbiE/DNA-binding transcriptional ArsR family regulator